MFLIFDTETTGLPSNYNAPVSDSENWPRLVQLAWQLHDETGKLISAKNYIVKPDGFTIPFNSAQIHGISTERALESGFALVDVLAEFEADRAKAKYAVGHNVVFDTSIIGAENFRLNQAYPITEMAVLDTKDLSTDFVAIPGRGGRFKWPTLSELHQKLFGKTFEDAHDAAYDVDATARCFFALLIQRVFEIDEIQDASILVYEAPTLAAANFAKADDIAPEVATDLAKAARKDISDLKDMPFAHLHCHTQYSVLQSASWQRTTLCAMRLKPMSRR